MGRSASSSALILAHSRRISCLNRGSNFGLFARGRLSPKVSRGPKDSRASDSSQNEGSSLPSCNAASLHCERGSLHWQGRVQCTIKYTWRTRNAGHGDFVRPHFQCPVCLRGCYKLYYSDAFMCRICSGLGYRDQQLGRNARCYACSGIGILRRKLGMSPIYFTRVPRRKNNYVRPRTDRLIAELKATERKVKRMIAREARHDRS